jgi:hypothetical protein
VTDLPRERHLVDLAIKLQHGEITPEEQREAANALSYTAGARLGYEHLARQLKERLDFITRVLAIFWKADNEDELFWRVDNDQVRLFVMCSDTFTYATADLEEITPANVHLLEQSVEEVRAVSADPYTWSLGFPLFCARIRGMRVMPMMELPDSVQEMFNACGPERTSNDFPR